MCLLFCPYNNIKEWVILCNFSEDLLVEPSLDGRRSLWCSLSRSSKSDWSTSPWKILNILASETASLRFSKRRDLGPSGEVVFLLFRHRFTSYRLWSPRIPGLRSQWTLQGPHQLPRPQTINPEQWNYAHEPCPPERCPHGNGEQFRPGNSFFIF